MRIAGLKIQPSVIEHAEIRFCYHSILSVTSKFSIVEDSMRDEILHYFSYWVSCHNVHPGFVCYVSLSFLGLVHMALGFMTVCNMSFNHIFGTLKSKTCSFFIRK